jgi:hypothetical protein
LHQPSLQEKSDDDDDNHVPMDFWGTFCHNVVMKHLLKAYSFEDVFIQAGVMLFGLQVLEQSPPRRAMIEIGGGTKIYFQGLTPLSIVNKLHGTGDDIL